MDVEHLLRTTLADQARDTPDPAADLFERGPAARRAHRRRLADTDPWHPVAHVDGVGSLTGEQWRALELSCPQTAPSDLLWD